MGLQTVLITFASLGIACLIPPLAWHIFCRNVPLIILIMWLFISNVKILVDAIVWGSSDFDQAWDGQVWCDIMVKIQVGTDSGVVTAISAIALNLYIILCADEITVAWFARPVRKLIIELMICLLTPIGIMASDYVISSSRYVIVRYYGCQYTYTDSWLVIILSTMWPAIWAVVAFVLSLMTLYRYYQRRRDVRDILKTTNSGLSLRKFARLLIFCIMIVLVMLPLSLYLFIVGFQYYTNAFQWSVAHNPVAWDTIFFMESSDLYDRWITLSLSYLTFLVFGLGNDAIKMYKSVLRYIGLGSTLDKVEGAIAEKKLKMVEKLKLKKQEKYRDRSGEEDIESADSLDTRSIALDYYQLESPSTASSSQKKNKKLEKREGIEFFQTEIDPEDDLRYDEYGGVDTSLEEQQLYQQIMNEMEVEENDGEFALTGSVDYKLRSDTKDYV